MLGVWQGSAAEQAAEMVPDGVRVVAGLHTVSATSLADLEHPLDQDVLLCGDSRHAESYDHLLQDERADLIFTDPPFNVPNRWTCVRLGRIRHREFAMGVGEMSAAQRCRGGPRRAPIPSS